MITIDNVNGAYGDYQIAKSLIPLSSAEIIAKFLDYNVFTEYISKIIIGFDYKISNDQKNKYIIANHIISHIAAAKKSKPYYEMIRNQSLSLLNKVKLKDWKEYVIEQRKMYPIHNLYKVIKDFMWNEISPHIKKVLFAIDKSQSFYSFINNPSLFSSILSTVITNQRLIMQMRKKH